MCQVSVSIWRTKVFFLRWSIEAYLEGQFKQQLQPAMPLTLGVINKPIVLEFAFMDTMMIVLVVRCAFNQVLGLPLCLAQQRTR